MAKVIIGKAILKKDVVMEDSFQYAESFERILVKAGEYPIYSYEVDLKHRDGVTMLGWRNHIGYEGTVIDSNVGGKAGEKRTYYTCLYDYELAEMFFNGRGNVMSNTYLYITYELANNWTLKLEEFEYNGERHFSMKVVQK